MKLLIIGSKGFIGSHTLEYFNNENAVEVWGADVVTDYTEKNYFLVDATNSDFESFFQAIQFDVVVNCSGAASVPDSLKNPLRDFYLNTTNVVKILDSIRKHAPDCRFINLSSAAVYGNPKKLPINEMSDADPVSPYGKHKWYAEQICKEYYEHFTIATCSLRIFSAYGPGLKKQLFWDTFQKALVADNLTLFGTGRETRDFIYINDIVKAIEIIIDRGEFRGTTYNLASGVEITINEAATELLNSLGFTGSINFSGNERTGDPVNWVADISKLNRLGFYPDYSIEDGVKKYVQWLREEKLH